MDPTIANNYVCCHKLLSKCCTCLHKLLANSQRTRGYITLLNSNTRLRLNLILTSPAYYGRKQITNTSNARRMQQHYTRTIDSSYMKSGKNTRRSSLVSNNIISGMPCAWRAAEQQSRGQYSDGHNYAEYF